MSKKFTGNSHDFTIEARYEIPADATIGWKFFLWGKAENGKSYPAEKNEGECFISDFSEESFDKYYVKKVNV
jgi:hypothetical protein